MVGCIEDKLLFLIAFYPALITELLRLRTAGLQSVKTGVALHSNLRTKETLNWPTVLNCPTHYEPNLIPQTTNSLQLPTLQMCVKQAFVIVLFKSMEYLCVWIVLNRILWKLYQKYGKKLLSGHLMTNGTRKEYKCYFFPHCHHSQKCIIFGPM